jgi:galactarate dehydratase
MQTIQIVRPARMARRAAPLDTPRSIRMHDNDNVAIVANDGGLPAGAVFPTAWC